MCTCTCTNCTCYTWVLHVNQFYHFHQAAAWFSSCSLFQKQQLRLEQDVLELFPECGLLHDMSQFAFKTESEPDRGLPLSSDGFRKLFTRPIKVTRSNSWGKTDWGKSFHIWDVLTVRPLERLTVQPRSIELILSIRNTERNDWFQTIGFNQRYNWRASVVWKIFREESVP